jgi:formylglycine-generating enzyme required for sulfatase activity
MRAAAVLSILVGFGCTSTRTCKPGTVFIRVTYSGAAVNADSVVVDASVDGMGHKMTMLTHHPGDASGTIEVQFGAGYPSGHTFSVAITAIQTGSTIGVGTGSVVLRSSCEPLDVAIRFASDDLSVPVDLSGADFSVGDEGVEGDGAADIGGMDAVAALDMESPIDMASVPGPSCTGLAATCGPGGNDNCCSSPLVPGGTFNRRYDVAADGLHNDSSYPAMVSDFRLDKYEVTVGRFRKFLTAGMGTQASPPPAGAGARTLNGMANQGGWDSSWNANLAADTVTLNGALLCNINYQTWTDPAGSNEQRPINCVTWYEAMAFCIWDQGFLPTDAQSNYASSAGGEHRAYPWSTPPDSVTIDATYASYFVDATKQCFGDGVNGCAVTDLVPVGTKAAGAGKWGHLDLSGNVQEMTLDYDTSGSVLMNPCNDCAQLTPYTYRLARGGSFHAQAAAQRSADIGNSVDPTARGYPTGFRCAR